MQITTEFNNHIHKHSLLRRGQRGLCLAVQATIEGHWFNQGQGLELLRIRKLQLGQTWIKKKNYDNILLKVLFLPMACYSNSFYFRSLCFGAFNFVPVVVLKELRLVGLAKGLLLSFEGWKGSVCPRSWTWPWFGVEGSQNSKEDWFERFDPSGNATERSGGGEKQLLRT